MWFKREKKKIKLSKWSMTTPLVSFTFYTDQFDNSEFHLLYFCSLMIQLFSNYHPNIPFVCHSSLNLHFVGTNWNLCLVTLPTVSLFSFAQLFSYSLPPHYLTCSFCEDTFSFYWTNSQLFEDPVTNCLAKSLFSS